MKTSVYLSLILFFFSITIFAQTLPDDLPPVIEGNEDAFIDWTNQMLQAKGISFIDNKRFKNPAQAKLMAVRGAQAVAQRNLMELVLGISVTGVTTVRDFVTESDIVTTKLEGMVKNARMIGEPIISKDGKVEVTLQVAIYNVTAGNTQSVAQVVSEQLTDTSSAAYQTEMKRKGILCDSAKFRPSLLPVVKDMNGNALYNLTSTAESLLKGKKPVYLKSSDATLNALQKADFDGVLDAQLKDCELVVQDKSKLSKEKLLNIGKSVLKVGSMLLMFI